MSHPAASVPAPSDGDAIVFVDLAAQQARIEPEVNARIAAVLAHRRFINGPEISELETELARRAGVGHCVAVGSGTDALLVALLAHGIGPGDAVFVPAFTYMASANAVILTGATPVFVDIDPARLTIDPDDLERRLSQVRAAGTLTARALMPVDLFGLPADYDRLDDIARRNALFMLVDAAQSFGARLNDRPVGCFGDATAASFFPSKPLGCYGDGGALFTNDAVRASRWRSLRHHGIGEDAMSSEHVGLNARLDSLQAAVLLAKLGIFDSELEARERVAQRYDARLTDVVQATAPRCPAAQSAWASYAVQVPRRDDVAAALKAVGVPTAVYYPHPLHLQPAYRRYAGDALPVAEAVSRSILNLPIHPYLAPGAIDRICDSLDAAISG